MQVHPFRFAAVLVVLLPLACPAVAAADDPALPTPVRVADGFKFTEGPAWHPTERYLVFSDTQQHLEIKWTPGEGVSEFRANSGRANGHAFDAQGRLINCEGGRRQVTRREPDGTYTVLADSFEGNPLNAPNDVVVHPDGGIFFTNPNYGMKEGKDLQFIFRIAPDGTLEQAVPGSFNKPNGIGLSPDGKTLYVNITYEQRVLAWAIGDDGRPSGEPRVVVQDLDRDPDGMAVHPQTGDLYLCLFRTQDNKPDEQGINIYTPQGEFKGRIPVPGTTTNCCFDDTGKTLFVTSGGALYRIDFDALP